MKKILLFGLGNQGKKYMNHFFKKGFSIDVITKGGKQQITTKINNTFSFLEAKEFDKGVFDTYDFIIVCVKPYSEQDKVIELLISKQITTKVIIEKPVSYNLALLGKLEKFVNIVYFIDEICLGNLFKAKDIESIEIDLPNGDRDIYEHIIGFFILRDDFDLLLDKINLRITKEEEDILSYSIKFGNYIIKCKKGEYSVNNKKIINNFDTSLNFILNTIGTNQKINALYKTNYSLFQKYSNNNDILKL